MVTLRDVIMADADPFALAYVAEDEAETEPEVETETDPSESGTETFTAPPTKMTRGAPPRMTRGN